MVYDLAGRQSNGSGILGCFPENREKEQLGRPYSEREHGTMNELRAGHWDGNSESQDIERWGIVSGKDQSCKDSNLIYKTKGRLQAIIGHDHQGGGSRYRLL